MDIFSQAGRAYEPPEIAGHDPLRCLGSGAQGQVWLMAAQNSSRVVAAKFLRPTSTPAGGDGEADPLRHNESLITQEWRLLTQFHHEHLIPLYEVVRDIRGAFVLLMEYAAGGSLAQIVQAKGPMTVGETVTVLTPLGQVLSYLHGRGAVHGDVSPGNILLSAAGKPYLSDFGFGRMLGQPQGRMAGTPGFYCQLDTERNDASDVYALAAVGWFLLTGRPAPPTRERLPLGTFVPEAPAELVAALEAGLQEDSHQRPTASAFAQAVFRSARAEPVALGNAVHPSVLPELATRRDVKVAQAGKGASGKLQRVAKKILSPKRGRMRMRMRMRGRRRGSHTEPAVNRIRRRGPVWASEDGVVQRSRPHVKRRIIAASGVAAIALGAALMMTVNGSWGALGAHNAPQQPKEKAEVVEDVGIPWAAALPQDIRTGLLAHDPVAALRALSWTRAYALSNADPVLLEKINAPNSVAAEADRGVGNELEKLGHTFTGLEISVSNESTDFAKDPRTGGDSGSAHDPLVATVRATVTTSAFAEQDEAGAVVYHQSAAQTQELAIVLIRVEQRWTIQEVLAVGAQ
ncbi:Protein kinase domain-containing protein [Arthrobacter alpinus]|uniref:non-specific serine/threonine protein kinase n=1 Tax=Arthrobacter alpinus TaxID=656366 RepID=A0A1H5H146_9MICC|nr:serine/threonine-protein kinase [Arthrobacter alpinus]SEE21687.1 Protein kinase domain-containing protein [Arthrobacter alpinus]